VRFHHVPDGKVVGTSLLALAALAAFGGLVEERRPEAVDVLLRQACRKAGVRHYRRDENALLARLAVIAAVTECRAELFLQQAHLFLFGFRNRLLKKPFPGAFLRKH
jgi:hypothetical protein